MKLYLFLIIFIIILTGCVQKEIKKEVIKSDPKIETKIVDEHISLGWSNNDTYTVKVISEDLEKAKNKAKHKILQDIVRVRMMSESRFTDITKINSEFETPLKNGKVISEKKVESGLEIYYQIHDEGLKQKFEKK